MLPCLVNSRPHPRQYMPFLSGRPTFPVSELFPFALSRSLDALCSKSVHQPFSNQSLPHSFSKMPGCMGLLPCDIRLDVETFERADLQTTPRAIPFLFTFLRTLFPSTAHNSTCIPFLFCHLQTLCRHNGGGVQRHSSQRINMIEKTDNSISLNELSLCRHRTVSGRRCRLRVLNPESHLCFRHAQLRQKKRHAEDLACDLAGQLTEFTSAADINSFLSRLLLLQAHDRIAPRRCHGLHLQPAPPHPPRHRLRKRTPGRPSPPGSRHDPPPRPTVPRPG